MPVNRSDRPGSLPYVIKQAEVMVINQNLARGVFLAAVALFFAANALRLSVGDLARAGPGLFPLLVSGLLLFLAALTIIQARVAKPVPLQFSIKNIGVIMILPHCSGPPCSMAFEPGGWINGETPEA